MTYSDYRISKFDTFIYDHQNMLNDKKRLGNEINSRATVNNGNHYIKIRDKKSRYYHDFSVIYGNRCAYCGITTTINTNQNFEIDHFYPQANNGNHNVNNLVFSCHFCNQRKKNFELNLGGNVANTSQFKKYFKRDDHFQIIIDSKNTNEVVNDFYKKMKLGSSFRKLDYLLVELSLMNENSSMKMKEVLLKVYIQLLEIRNKTF